jgi:hypothetical protein
MSHKMHIIQYLTEWLRPRHNNDEVNESLASSFVCLSNTWEVEDTKSDALIANLIRIHTELSLRTDLRPCEDINRLFEELVELCTQTVSERVADKVRKHFLHLAGMKIEK